MILLAMKTEILVTIIAVLIIQWLLAILALYLLFKDNGIKKNILPWNIFIMFGFIIGPITYFVYRKIKKNKA